MPVGEKVGKSSLINHLLGVTEEGGAEGLEVGALTKKGGFGAHTTTNSRLLRLPASNGGAKEGSEATVIDSPGIRDLHLWHMHHRSLLRAFPEIEAAALKCQYRNCRHDEGQKGCAVRRNLRSGEVHGEGSGGIMPSRLQSYFDLLAECEEGANYDSKKTLN